MLKLVKISRDYVAEIIDYRQEYKFDRTIPGAHLLKNAKDVQEWIKMQATLEIGNNTASIRPKQISRLLIDDEKPGVILGIITYRKWETDSHIAMINGNLKFSISPSLRHTGLGVLILWLFARLLDEYDIQEFVAVVENDNTAAIKLMEYYDGEITNKIYTGADYCTAYTLSTQHILSSQFEL